MTLVIIVSQSPTLQTANIYIYMYIIIYNIYTLLFIQIIYLLIEITWICMGENR